MASSTVTQRRQAAEPGDDKVAQEAQEAPAAPSAPVGPKGKGWVTLEELTQAEDVWSMIIWGPEGTGKTRWPLLFMPTPIMVLNLDRPLTRGHMGWKGMKERAPHIFVKNLRETTEDINNYAAVEVKEAIEKAIDENLTWLKGGTLLIDGGTLLREVLKLADPTLGPKLDKGTRFNPKDKAQVNAYLASFMSSIQDKGINLVITAHSANTWKMENVATDDGGVKKQLTRTNNLYPKFDDIGFERCSLSLLMFKRCECGKNIVNQDGTCIRQPDPTEDRAEKQEGHQGRRHITRIVANKYNTATEGTEWEDLTGETLRILCTDPKKAQLLMSDD